MPVRFDHATPVAGPRHPQSNSPELFLGTMTFGQDWGWGAPPEKCRRMLDAYAEAGGNVIDTAVNYTDGASERIVGEFIRSQRDHFVLSTKYTLTTDPSDRRFPRLRRDCAASS